MVEVSGLIKLSYALSLFKAEAGGNPPTQLLQVFCCVAANPGCLQQDMEKLTGMGRSSCSRMIKWLGPTKMDGSPGLCLIKVDTNPDYWKQNVLKLTPKGEGLAERLADYLTI
tara:strand:+ start:100 stop:438 length:339 start_codon:yes stop_codon:yes gene_type:complete